jgi:hypothetical protein
MSTHSASRLHHEKKADLITLLSGGGSLAAAAAATTTIATTIRPRGLVNSGNTCFSKCRVADVGLHSACPKDVRRAWEVEGGQGRQGEDEEC